MSIYGISGFLAAIGGILVMGRLQSGAYQNGTNMTLTSVAAVVIGGTSLSGGVGGIWGTLIGVFIIRLVEAGLVYLRRALERQGDRHRRHHRAGRMPWTWSGAVKMPWLRFGERLRRDRCVATSQRGPDVLRSIRRATHLVIPRSPE